ncbi:receptor-like protein kinase [Gossypium australe]|uniref:Receptor-like protein kinase n=1 Tax=Gossypium australe TaxID=47621 RepID=A0A5B6VPL2_9ROSI|nr:receptor-like protein kinase [Gossypium australe]
MKCSERWEEEFCVLNNLKLKRDILFEAPSSMYSIHPSSPKMFGDLKQMYWWPAYYDSRVEMGASYGGFRIGLPVTPRKKDSIWVIVNKLTKLTHFILIRTDYSLESSRFIWLHDIIERISPVAYILALPPELEKIHNVFHVLMLRWYISDPSHVISSSEIELQLGLSYLKESIRILAREVKELQNKRVVLVKVLWHRYGIEKATWETEESMKLQYLNQLSGKSFEDETL